MAPVSGACVIDITVVDVGLYSYCTAIASIVVQTDSVMSTNRRHHSSGLQTTLATKRLSSDGYKRCYAAECRLVLESHRRAKII